MVMVAGPIERISSGPLGPKGDMDLIWDRLAALRDGAAGFLRIHRPGPTAAFSRRDSLRPGYQTAQRAVARHGFAPVLRPAGGHLAVYDRGAVVVDLVACAGAERDPMTRFAMFSDGLGRALGSLGVDTTIAPLPGEYCPGTFSLQARGRKVAGLAQRQTKHGVYMGAVVMVGAAGAPRAAMTEAYSALDLHLDPETIGSLTDVAPEITQDDLETALMHTLDDIIDHHPAPTPREGAFAP